MAEMKVTYPVIGKQRWDMVSEQDGSRVMGSKIFVYDGMVNNTDKVGLFPTTFNLKHEDYNLFEKVPGNYELVLSMKTGSKGQFSVIGAKYIGEYKI